MFGKQRRWQSLADDPHLPFMVGRLIGANEMAVAMLSKEENDTAQRVANVLAGATRFFMEGGVPTTGRAEIPKPELTPASEAQTEVRPPK